MVTPTTLAAEPACPTTDEDPRRAPDRTHLRVERRSIAEIDRATWDALAGRNPWATPFSDWAFQRAWWDAYGTNADEVTLVVLPAAAPPGAAPVAIVPLMVRHEVEPDDAVIHTTMRHGADAQLTPVPPNAAAAFFGASYHADYATVLAAPDDLPAVADALVGHLAEPARRHGWDVADLRRLRVRRSGSRCVGHGLRHARDRRGMDASTWSARTSAPSSRCRTAWTSTATSGRSARRSVTRSAARSVAPRRSARSGSRTRPTRPRDLEAFVELHQKRWGADGLFPATPGGAQSRVFFRRLFELHGPDGPLRLTFVSVGGRRIAAGVHFETAGGLPLLQRGDRSRRSRPVARRGHGPRLRRAGDRGRDPPARLPARQRALQVRVGRRRRTHPTTPRPT